MKLSWKSLEDAAISAACAKWKCHGGRESIDGINFDCVLRPSQEEIILIEVSKENDLDKVRQGMARINAVRIKMATEGITCRSYILLEKAPTNSMRQTAKSNRINVMSLEEFIKTFFNYDNYSDIRSHQPFGSAINPDTGEPDTIPYIAVHYEDAEDGSLFDAKSIAHKLILGEKILLIGDYGTGKSRCINELFQIITKDNRRAQAVFAINLRDHWGASTASAIIGGHLDGLGLSNMIDAANQVMISGGAIILLDGVDEVGAQLFGANKDSRKSVRSNALQGVRRLIERNTGGVLVTTRPHYFDSDQEMLNATGLSNIDHIILRCPDEFSSEQSRSYLGQIGISRNIPDWLPRKPLVFHLISTIEKSIVDALLCDEYGEFDFWKKFFNAICLREAKIHGSIDSDSVRNILIKLAEKTRVGSDYLGRLSTRDVREVYESVIHDSPDEAGEQMLMRLCTLGRVGPESPERQFVDEYIVDSLRAEALVFAIDQQSREISKDLWRQPLRCFGWRLLQDDLLSFNKEAQFRAALGFLYGENNNQALAEIMSVLSDCDGEPIDIKNTTISDVDIHSFVVGRRILTNISIENSFIHNLHIVANHESKSTILINDCQIIEIFGVSSEIGIPKWITNSGVEKIDSLSTANRIKNAHLKQSQVIFLATIHKIFFQIGRGRKEQALKKGGFGKEFDPKIIETIINILMREKIIERIKGNEGYIYKPVRKHTKRMQEIKSLLTLSNDPLWLEVSKLS